MRILFLLLLLNLTRVEAYCWTVAEKNYGIPATLLYAIAKHESGLNPKAKGAKNKNGSYDIGLMQINSYHLPLLKKYGYQEANLYDACTSIKLGAWLLANNFKRLGYNWRAIGAYNAKNETLRNAYAWKIYKQLHLKKQQLHFPERHRKHRAAQSKHKKNSIVTVEAN